MYHKKRLRYKLNAMKIAAREGIPLNPDNWEEIWNILNKYKEPYYIYFIGCPGAKEVKIGRSKNPGQRLKTLQTSSPEKLYLYGYFLEKDDITEKNVHHKFKHLRKTGEWFLYNDELQQYLYKMRAE